MLSQFEVFAKCPKNGDLVNTGATTLNATFNPDDKSMGAFNCSSCKGFHSWSYEDAEIREVHR